MRRLLVALVCALAIGGGQLAAPASSAPRPIFAFATGYETPDLDIRIKYSDGTISGPIDLPSVHVPNFVGAYQLPSLFEISPDGTKIVFVAWSGTCARGACQWSESMLYMMNIDGTGVMPIYKMHEESFDHILDPAWSPDGNRIMFMAGYRKVDGRRRHPDLWVLDRDAVGNWQPSLLSGRPGREAWPEWSPDGRFISYEYIPDEDGFVSKGDYHRASSVELASVDDPNDHVTIARGPLVTDPAFSPDGRWIAYADNPAPWAADGTEIKMVRVDGSGRRTLARDLRYPWALDFSPDGHFIVFGEGWKHRTTRIMRVAVDAPHALKVVHDSPEEFDHYPDYFPLP